MSASPRLAGDALSARVILEVAAEVEAAELRIKQEILRAAAAGDLPRITELVVRWLEGPAEEVLHPAPSHTEGLRVAGRTP